MAKNEENVNSVSRISAGTSIVGDIYSTNDLRIDGSFEGRIFSKGRIVVGEGAELKGDIACANLDLWGKASGDIYIKDTLSLKGGSTIDGNLNIRRLLVELGASFNGTCRMITEEEFDKASASMEQMNRQAAPAKESKKEVKA